MKFKTLELSREEAVLVVRITRPEALNSLNKEVIDELFEAMHEHSRDSESKVIVITGAGDKSFVAGADIKFLSSLSPREMYSFIGRAQEVTFTIEKSPKPVIAMVNGYALGGGCELAMACDLILASERAIFGQPEVGLGIIPGMGGTQRLTRLIGRNLAKEFVLTGDSITAHRAYEIGLVNRIFPHDKLEEETLKVAKKIASNAPFAVTTAKRAINEGIDMELRPACYMELNSFALGVSTKDAREGMAAFMEKRKPVFTGK